ncbi:hypothetical protein C7974DRAFT_435617 [Boeremia exigua]|uniref:uncharacterized protein n=1 Tax=Boeremia exigua TaxID=749465 RepID=UPI001E8DAF3A|nr:uncharacterized protein C7974DRAFT_435617 [Boeremia exigua]KAH6620176.1 hypothetical protein C7974DRAFT_435617 [Boeremia exigua]
MFKLTKLLVPKLSWPLLKFPISGFKVVSDAVLFEEEQPEEFHRGVYYPVNIGDVFASNRHTYTTLKYNMFNIKPMWDSFEDILNRNPAHHFTGELLKAGLSQNVDIRADTILIETEDQHVLKAFVHAEMASPSRRKVVNGRPTYATRHFRLPKEYGRVVLGDFGFAVRGDNPRIYDAQPDIYRSDIWNVEATDKHLFYGINPTENQYLTRALGSSLD